MVSYKRAVLERRIALQKLQIAVLTCIVRRGVKRRRRHRWWVHPVNRKRRELGAKWTLFHELTNDSRYVRLHTLLFIWIISTLFTNVLYCQVHHVHAVEEVFIHMIVRIYAVVPHDQEYEVLLHSPFSQLSQWADESNLILSRSIHINNYNIISTCTCTLLKHNKDSWLFQ